MARVSTPWCRPSRWTVERFGKIKIRDEGDDAMVRFANVKILLEDVDHSLLNASSFDLI